MSFESKARALDFFLSTALGRFILILFILGMIYINKMLGVVAVLLIVIMFNQSNLDYMEGFSELSANVNQIKTSLSETNTTSKQKFTGQEGFNIIDRENTILRGKNSNQIPVSSTSRNQADDIEATDTTVFTNLFSAF